MKKVLIGVLIAFIIAICLPYWVDDFACYQYKKEIENAIADIQGVEVLDMLNGCGNPANGNHTDLIVTVLVETDLTEENLKNIFPDAFDIIAYEDLHFDTKTSKQFARHVIDDTKNYFVLVYAESAPFWYIDLRGH